MCNQAQVIIIVFKITGFACNHNRNHLKGAECNHNHNHNHPAVIGPNPGNMSYYTYTGRANLFVYIDTHRKQFLFPFKR